MAFSAHSRTPCQLPPRSCCWSYGYFSARFPSRLPSRRHFNSATEPPAPCLRWMNNTPSIPMPMGIRTSPISGPAFPHTHSVLPMAECLDSFPRSEPRRHKISSHRPRCCRSNLEAWQPRIHGRPHHPADNQDDSRSSNQTPIMLAPVNPQKSTVESLQGFR